MSRDLGAQVRKNYRETLTPHRLSVAVLIQEFFKTRLNETTADFTKQHIRDFCMLILRLIQSPDLLLGELHNILKNGKVLIHQEVINGFNQTLKQFNIDGIDYLLQIMDDIGKLILRDPDIVVTKVSALISKRSVIGYYLRRLLINFDKLTFSEVSSVVTSFQRYYSYEVKDDKDISLNQINLIFCEDWYSNKNRWSKRQAELFIASQAALLNNHKKNVVHPKALGYHIKNLIRSNPDLAEAHFLNYLNYLRVKDFCGAINSLYHCFDKHGLTEGKGGSDEQTKGFRFASLNLAVLFFQFGHKDEALAALKEAITLAQQTNDNVCLQHALTWLYCFTNKNKEKLLEHSILKSLDLNLPYIVSLGIQSFVQYAGISGGKPKFIFETITRSDIVNCQHAYGDLTCSSYSEKSGLWLFYGKSEMSTLWSQLLLHLNSDSNPRSISCFGESLCQSVCNVGLHLLNQGKYNKAYAIIMLARSKFPHEPLSHIWLLSECIFIFTRCLFHEEWIEAEAAAQKMAVYDKYESQLRMAELFLQKQDFNAANKCINKLIDTQNDSEMRLRIDYNVRALILYAQIRYASCYPAVVPPAAIHACLAYANDFHVDYFAALTNLHLANMQYLMKLPAQALKLLERCLMQILTHGGVYDQGRAMLLYVKCVVANTITDPIEDRHKVIIECTGILDKVIEKFLDVEAYSRVKDALILQAYLYNEVNLFSDRNKCGLEIRRLEEEYPSANNVIPITLL